MEQFEKLKQLVLSAEEDAVRFYSKNNLTAGTRLRKKMQEIKVIAQSLRTDVISIRASRYSNKEQ